MRRAELMRLAVMCLAIVLGEAGAQAEQRLQGPRPVVWRDFLGVNAHFLWFSPEQYRQQMDRLQDLGLEWTRIDLHWDIMEPEQGQLRTAELDELTQTLSTRQLKSEMYLVGSPDFASSGPFGVANRGAYPPRDPALYASSLVKFASRYPSVQAWQVWNEPNLPSYWQPFEDPERYARLLQASVEAMRSQAPGREVVMGGMAYYSQMPVRGGLMLESLGKLGVQRLGTVIAYHPYSQYPEGDDPKARDFIVRAQLLNEKLRGIAPPAIWADEWGWSSYPGPQEEQNIIGEEGQADFVLRRLALMSALDYDRIFLFALSDLDGRASVRDQHYGLLRLDGSPKPVYRALQRFLALTGPRLTPVAPPTLVRAPDELYSIAWRRNDGSQVWLFWSAGQERLQLPQITQATLHDPLTGESHELNDSSGIAVQAKASLQMLTWK
ncbi:beta-xylosidase [Pseudomonas sp. JUb52]|uniref:beta-xylosidase n=1 Tax=Pseudomonas sp. JUb52 TaxID=2485127 RepID=UPI0010CF5AC8|nr:beta-xylosidase [Pseudomonas sp. JUb52]TCQ83933.1 beta-xylosidase [Pseudomonas sp. JUb52]